MSFRTFVALGFAASSLIACGDDSSPPTDTGADARPDAPVADAVADAPVADGPAVDAPVADAPVADALADAEPDMATSTCPSPIDQLDVLIVVDNSNSMTEEQESFVTLLPSFMEFLGRNRITARFGVISTDMGIGGNTVPTCDDTEFGDDGVMRTAGNTDRRGCNPTYPQFIRYGMGDSSGLVSTDLTCVVAMGTQGCGFEQQLDATLKSLTPSTSGTTFVDGSTGHGDGANDGFLRPEAALAIFIVTDEDDCSASDPDIFNPGSTRYPGENLNLRCFEFPEAVHPTTRYVEGLLALKTAPRRVAFIPIAGVPVDLAGDDFSAILADERMVERVESAQPGRLVPSCDVPGRGVAYPARRIVEVARGLAAGDAQAEVVSICQASFGTLDSQPVRRALGICEG